MNKPAMRMLMLMLLSLPVGVRGQDYKYSVYHCPKSAGLIITKYTGSGGAVTIPNAINGLTVTGIGEAFFGCHSLTSITIPNSVTSISGGAFTFCDHLTNVTIGSSITSIGYGYFTFCDPPITIIIPNSVNDIGGVLNPKSVLSVFDYCTSLSAITVDAHNPAYSSMDGVLFNKSQTKLIECPGGKAGNYTIPNTATNIEYEAFKSCEHLTTIMIPNSITSIGGMAFWGCCSLTNITIPKSVIDIGDKAFQHCPNLTGIYFKGNAPSLGFESLQSMFLGTDEATIYYLPGTTGWGTTFGGRPTAIWKQ